MSFRRQPSKIAKMHMVIRVLIVLIITFIAAAYFDIFENVFSYVEMHEDKNYDEFFVVAIVLSIWLLGELLVLNRKLKLQSLLNQEFAVKDDLTGLNNRRGFFENVGNCLRYNIKKNLHTIIIYIDVNKFKNINDTYGHAVGDDVLIYVAKILHSIADEDDVIARIGGDEFIIMCNCESDRLKDNYINRLVNNTKFYVDDNEKYIEVELSFGIAEYPKDGSTIDDLLCMADKRMYEMKQEVKEII